MKEREINLLDLIVEILLQWRVFMVIMVICVLVIGVFSYVQSVRKASAEVTQLEDTGQSLQAIKAAEAKLATPTVPKTGAVEWARKRLNDTQFQNVEYVLKYEDLLAKRKAYSEQSALMQMDSDRIYRAAVTFYITSEERQKSYSIEKIYEDIIKSAGMSEYLADTLNLQPSNVTELVSLQSDTVAKLEGKDSFTVEILHYNERSCMSIARAIRRFIDQQHDELNSILGEHEIIALEPSIAMISSTTVLNYQRNFLNDLIGLQNTISTRKNNFSANEWLYYDIFLNGKMTKISSVKFAEQATENEERDKLAALANAGPTQKAGVNIRYVVLGAILPAFLYAFWLVLAYIMNTRLRATDNFQECYAIPQLGLIPGVKKEKKYFKAVDRWILSLRDRNKRKFVKEEAIELSSVAVKISAERDSLNTVYLIGCNLKEGALTVCEAIQKKLNCEELQIHILNNILYDAQAMSDLEKARGVVLVEKAGSTLYDEVIKELELLKRQEIKVLGGIMVE